MKERRKAMRIALTTAKAIQESLAREKSQNQRGKGQKIDKK